MKNKRNKTIFIITILIELAFFVLFYDPFLRESILYSYFLTVPFALINILLFNFWLIYLFKNTDRINGFKYIDTYFMICEIIILIAFKTLIYIKTTTPTLLIVSGILLDLILLTNLIIKIFKKDK